MPTEDMRARASEIIEDLRHLEGPLLPILNAFQEEFSHVPHDLVPLLAETLNLSRADVHGVVTFYHDYRPTPPGRHVLRICRAEACQSLGAEELGRRAREQLSVDWHETTDDGACTLEPVYCLGLCACGPAAMLDGRMAGRLDSARLDALLDEARQ